MDTTELEKILRHTLSDRKLSRGEKRVLQSTIEQFGKNDPHRLNVIRALAFDIAKENLADPNSVEILDWLEGVAKVLVLDPEGPKIETEAVFSPSGDAVGKINGLIATSQNRIDICVFTITDDRIADELLEAQKRRVKVRIITDDEKAFDAGSDVSRLKRAGIPMRTDRTKDHMHHKYAIFDEDRLLTGSYNWTRSASKYNEENFIVTNDLNLVRQFQAHYDRLWKELAD